MISVNKVVLPVAIDSLSYDEELVGSTQRNANGYAIRDRRGAKATIAFSTTPKDLDEAMMYRALLVGEGEFYPFNANGDVYGTKGLKAEGSGSSGVTGAIGANPLGGGYDWVTDTNTDLFIPVLRPRLQTAVSLHAPNPGIDGVTIIGFRTVAGASPRIFGWSWRSAVTAIDTKRERLGTVGATGAPQAYTGNESVLTFNGVTVTARTPTAETTFSALFMYPRWFPATQIDALMAGYDAGGYAAPRMPRVLVETDLFPGTLASSVAGARRTFVALADVRVTVVPHWRGGAFVKSGVALEVDLMEV